MNRCKTCRHWSKKGIPHIVSVRTPAHIEDLTKNGEFGDCDCYEKFESNVFWEYWPRDGLVYGSDTDVDAWILVGEDFGCIHWRGKDESVQDV